MNKFFLGMSLLLFSATAFCGNDVWQTLFKQKLQEARQGNSDAQLDVGSMYQKGRGVKPNRDKAIWWYKKSASLDNQKAARKLTLMKMNQSRFKKELARAETGDMGSQYNAGSMLMNGIGVNIEIKEAISWFEKSANQGHKKAGFKLGKIFNEGTGIKRNRRTAFKWFKASAEKGYPTAQYYLGKMYASGQGVKQDYGAALEWLSRAVDGGFNQARGEMIDVSEKMNAKQGEETKPVKQVVTKKSAPVANKKRSVKTKTAKTRTRKSVKTTKKSTGNTSFSMEDLMLATWNRNEKPVAYLPSRISTCRTEDSKLVCYSDDQVRKTGNGNVKFKTKSIISNFKRIGTFAVAYRNLVTNSTQAVTYGSYSDEDDIGEVDSGENSYQVKTGWGKAHKLECQMKNAYTVSCLKNKTHAYLLTSPQTLASGR